VINRRTITVVELRHLLARSDRTVNEVIVLAHSSFGKSLRADGLATSSIIPPELA
jgi:hypothetical protein